MSCCISATEVGIAGGDEPCHYLRRMCANRVSLLMPETVMDVDFGGIKGAQAMGFGSCGFYECDIERDVAPKEFEKILRCASQLRRYSTFVKEQ